MDGSLLGGCMANWKIALGLLGLFLFAAGLLALIAPQLLPAMQLASIERVEGRAEIDSRYQAETAGPFIFDTIKVDVTYSARIREDETLNIEARASQFARFVHLEPTEPGAPRSTDDREVEVFDKLTWPIRLALSGAAFDIDPKERVFPKGAPLPLKAIWTALPDRTGQHALVLDWSGVEPPDSGWYPDTEDTRLSVNGQTVEVQSAYLSLPVEVVTKWGIPQFWADIAGGAISLIGFLLGLPLIGWLWRRFAGGGLAP